MDRKKEALSLVEECLKELDSSKGSVRSSIQKLYRASEIDKVSEPDRKKMKELLEDSHKLHINSDQHYSQEERIIKRF